MKPFICLLVLVLFLTPVTSYGDLFNNRNNLIGNRAALMGGAYTALSEDLSGAFYNPAGIAFMDRTAVTMSAHVYSYSRHRRVNMTVADPLVVRNFPGMDTPDPIENRFDRVYQSPTTIGIAGVVNKKIGLSLSAFQVDRLRLLDLGFSDSGDFSITVDGDYETWLMGPSVSYLLYPNLSIGASLFAHYFQGSSSMSFDSVIGSSLRQSDVTSLGFYPVIGVRYNKGSRFKCGASLSFETVPITGNRKVVYRRPTEEPPFTSQPVRKEVNGDVRMPTRLAVGFATRLYEKYTVSFDAIRYFKLDYKSPHDFLFEAEPDISHRERAHYDFSLGSEIPITDRFKLQLGLFTNSSGATGQNASERVDMYGVSLGGGYWFKGVSTYMGFMYQEGKSGKQSSDFSPGMGFRDIARWERRTVSIVLGGTVGF